MNVDEQIKNLKDLGLTIEDEGSAKTFLNNVSYFRLIKAYGLGLKDENLRFKTGVTFNQIKGVYLFNGKFRHLIFAELEKVEVNLRCRIANYFSCKYGVLGYKDSSNFQDPAYHNKFLVDIHAEVNRNKKSPFVRNFENNYEGGELPFYALVELFSFGMLSKFFKNMKNEDKKAIAVMYGVKYTYLESWFEHLAFVRNNCAHYGRLYNMKMSITPVLYKQYTDKGIGNLRVFASLICLKHLLPNDEHWNKFVVEISLLFEDFPCVRKELMGFPENDWEKLLVTPLKEL
jgi:abortive infection bacteriophage resistance protein